MKQFVSLGKILEESEQPSTEAVVLRIGKNEMFVTPKFLKEECPKILKKTVIGVGNTTNIYYGPAMLFVLALDEES